MTWYAWVMVVVLALMAASALAYAASGAARRRGKLPADSFIVAAVFVALLIGVVALATRGDC